jgi:hypothetical protein
MLRKGYSVRNSSTEITKIILIFNLLSLVPIVHILHMVGPQSAVGSRRSLHTVCHLLTLHHFLYLFLIMSTEY